MGDTTLRELVYGKGAHVDPIACVEDISAELASQVVEGYPHSIWQIVEHMSYWMEYDLGKIAGENPVCPDRAIESWPSHPDPVTEAGWQKTVKKFVALLVRMATLSESDQETLEKTVENVGPTNSPRTSNIHRMLWQVAVHNSYHVGQIALLRRQLDTWPPRRGGDTW